jgi:MioC protein
MSFFKISAWLSKIKHLSARSHPNHKTHDYTQSYGREDYIFEPIEEGKRGYLTGQGKGIKRGDYLILSDGSHCHRYQVEDIDYYSNSSDMWIALLKKMPIE